jgi:hypothetical protein
LNVISVNALKPVTTRVTGARAHMHSHAVTLADAPRRAPLARLDPSRRAAFRRSSAVGLRRLDLAGTRLA